MPHLDNEYRDIYSFASVFMLNIIHHFLFQFKKNTWERRCRLQKSIFLRCLHCKKQKQKTLRWIESEL